MKITCFKKNVHFGHCSKMAAAAPIKVGTRVEVVGKGVIGTVAYIGTTVFSSGQYTLNEFLHYSDSFFFLLKNV